MKDEENKSEEGKEEKPQSAAITKKTVLGKRPAPGPAGGIKMGGGLKLGGALGAKKPISGIKASPLKKSGGEEEKKDEGEDDKESPFKLKITGAKPSVGKTSPLGSSLGLGGTGEKKGGLNFSFKRKVGGIGGLKK